MVTGLVYDIQGYSVHDGPGIRTTVFLKGCPLACPWCHSPESQSFQPQVCFKKTSCMGADACGRCLEACPAHALTREGETEGERCLDAGASNDDARASTPQRASASEAALPRRRRSRCSDCAACVEVCPPKAFYVCGKEYSVKEALGRVLRDKPFYESSGGGVTLSGGEPLCQIEFAESFLKACHDEGLHTALDTTGYAPASSIERVLPYTDLFLYDLKHLDSAKHRQATGVPNERILDNARLIASRGGKIQVRVPLIPQFNDSKENLEATAGFCKELRDALTCVQLLPYHTLGVAKHERLQHGEKVFVATPMSDKRAEQISMVFEAKGIDTVIH